MESPVWSILIKRILKLNQGQAVSLDAYGRGGGLDDL